MLLLLVGSLGLAYGLVVRGSLHEPLSVLLQPVSDDEVTFHVPEGWKAIPEPTYQLARVLGAYQDPDAFFQLIVATLVDNAPRSPQAALREAQQALFQQTPIQVLKQLQNARIQLLANQSMIGLRYTGKMRGRQGMLIQHVAVLSQDARQYWVIGLIESPGGARSVGPQLHEAICKTLVSHQWGPATRQHLGEVWLDGGMQQLAGDASIATMVRRGHVVGDPMMVAVSDGSAQVQTIRLMVSYDAAMIGQTMLPTPQTLLENEYGAAADHLSRHAEAFKGRGRRSVDRIPGLNGAWRAVISSDQDALSRQLWYVPLPQHHVALFELLGPDGVMHRLSARARSLVSIMQIHRPVDADVEQVVRAALTRGDELAHRIRNGFGDQIVSGWTHSILKQNGQVVAASVDRVLPRSRRPLPLEGWSRYQAVAGSRPVTFQWRGNLDLSELHIDEVPQRSGNSGAQVEGPSQFVLAQRHITLTHRSRRRSWPVPPAYVPPVAEDDWQGEPVIAWFSRGLGRPEPCWITVPDASSGPLVVQIRRMMNLDASRLLLDSSGRTQRVELYVDTSRPLGGRRMLSYRANREEFISLVPGLAAGLEQQTQ